METPTSLFLLFISVFLVIGIVDFISPTNSDQVTEFDIRDHQVRSMGNVLLRWYPEVWSNEIIDQALEFGNDTVYFWDGFELKINRNNGLLEDDLLIQFFMSTPDDLPCILTLDVNDGQETEITGSHVIWTHGDLGYSVSLVLPLERNTDWFVNGEI